MSSELFFEHSGMPLIVRKVTIRFLPMLLMMYVLAYLDRANIGFAQQEMQADLRISTGAFALGSGLFFVGYAVTEIPSNLLMAHLGAKIWLSRIMVTFGLVATCTAFVHTAWTFYSLRILLGITEGGLFPGIILFLTYWIPANYWVRVMGVFIFGAPLAFVVGGPITTALLSLNGRFGLQGWQIMFLVTGIATTIVGFWAYFYIDNHPREASFLTDLERSVLHAQIRLDFTERERISPQGLLCALMNWRVLFFTLIYFTIQIGIFSVVFYLPTRISAMTGQTSGLANGLLTAIPWTLSIIAVVILSWIADRYQRPALLASCCLLIGGLGIIVGVMSREPLISLIAFSMSVCGLISVQPIYWRWPTRMLAGTAATGGLAFINAIGNLGGFFAPNLKVWIDVRTGNRNTGLAVLGAIAALGSLLLLFADIVRRSTPLINAEPASDCPE